MSQQPTLAYESPTTSLNGVGIGTIALQVLGVFFMLLAITALGTFIPYLGRPGFAGQLIWLSIGTQIVAYAVVGFAIIRLAPRLSIWLFGKNAAGMMAGPVTSSLGLSIQAIAFSVIGVWVMAGALPQLAAWVVLQFQFQTASASIRYYSSDNLADAIGRLIVGLALFLGSKGLSRLWHRLRDPAPPIASIHSGDDRA